MTMRERMTRAVLAFDDGESMPNDVWALGIADAVLDAMREPTKPMMDAGDSWLNHHADCVYTVWQAMIDAAKEEG